MEISRVLCTMLSDSVMMLEVRCVDIIIIKVISTDAIMEVVYKDMKSSYLVKCADPASVLLYVSKRLTLLIIHTSELNPGAH